MVPRPFREPTRMVITRKAKARTVPSTRLMMAMFTRTLETDGIKLTATPIHAAGEGRIRAADPRRSGEATMVGNPGRIVLVARGVAEVAVVSVADKNLDV